MNLPLAEHAPYARVARKPAASAALVVLATGVLVLLGWLLDIPSLKSVLPGFVTMKANTAVGFILAGMSLALFGLAARSVRIRRLSQACAGATALLGLLTLGQYLFALDFGIDQALFREPAGAIKTLSPGRMAPSTALNFLLMGSALLLAGFRRGIRIAQPLALLAGWIGLQALIGYLYGASALYGIGVYTQMAMHTAVTFVILGLGVLLAHPAGGFMRTVTSNTMGGLLIRRIMPFVVVLPVVLGWLRVQGEEHGYFDSAFGVALMMIVIMLIAVGVTWWTAGTLNRIDMARRQTQAELRESEKRFMDVLYASRDAILLIDGEMFVDCNEATARMLGYATRDEFLMTHPSKLSPATQPDGRDSFEKANEMMRTAFEAGFNRFEWMHRRASGEDFPVEVSLTPVVIQGKTVLHCVWRDITEQKRTAAELARERENLKAIFEASPVGLLLMDDSAVVTAVNDVASRLAGKTSAEMINRQPGEALGCVHASDDVRGCGHGPCCPTCPVRAAIEGVLKTGQSLRAFEVQPVLVVGGAKVSPWIEISAEPMMIDGRRHVIASVANITDRKRMERELRRLAVIVEQAAEGIAVADLDGNLQFVNHAWARMHGYESGAELVGKHLKAFHTDEQMKTEVAPFNATVKRQGHNWAEVGHVRRDGTAFPTQMSAIVLKDEQGEPCGLAGFAEDITNRKRAEEAVRQAKVEAEQANAAKSEFLANMSHEIRTPMTAILGFTEMIGNSLECCVTCPEHQACPTRTQNKESVQIIRRNGEHLLELINDILDISKIEAGKFVMDVQACSLPALVADVVSMMRVRAEQRGILLSVEYETEIPETVRTDGARVHQALVNLVGNAVKFTERGGVRVVASFLPAWREGRPAVRVRVIDTGIGISEEKLAHLFQPFVQVDASTSRKYGGTGLGLAISRRLAELLGGELAVESTAGKGSTFTLTIPTGSLEGVRMLKDPAEAVHGEAAGLHVPAAGEKVLAGTRILVAEDGPDNQRLIQTILSMAGAQVELAADGREAVAKAQAASFDVILMDMQMPVMDGYEAARLLRAQGYGVPILALTAHAMTGDRDKCLAAGCTDHLTKPIDRGRLIEAVARHAGKEALGQGQAAPTPESPAGDPEVMRSQYAADPELVGVLGQFVNGLPGQIEAMSLAARAGLWEELRRLAHRLKGAGGSYGYPSLTEAARGLEDAARAGDVEVAGMALGRLIALSRAVVRGAALDAVSKEVT